VVAGTGGVAALQPRHAGFFADFLAGAFRVEVDFAAGFFSAAALDEDDEDVDAREERDDEPDAAFDPEPELAPDPDFDDRLRSTLR
jgi:hypothetical protein